MEIRFYFSLWLKNILPDTYATYFFIHSSIRDQLDYFHSLATVNVAAKSMDMRVLLLNGIELEVFSMTRKPRPTLATK